MASVVTETLTDPALIIKERPVSILLKHSHKTDGNMEYDEMNTSTIYSMYRMSVK